MTAASGELCTRVTWAEQLEQDSWDRTAGTGQPGQDSRDRTAAGTGQPGQDSSRNRTAAGTRQPRQERRDMTTGTGQSEKTDLIVKPGWETEDRTARTWQQGQES
jgi:hypothetical protein